MAGVGAMIESPDFYPFLSGRENLRVMAGHAGVGPERVEAVLEIAELASRADDRFGTYSMGMKQRLGLAAALLKEPELLVLDEPTTGLDPAGIAEMRTLLRRLGTGSRTVLLSSHLMTEVEQTCDRVGIIRRGRLVAEGTLDELRGQPTLHLRVVPVERAVELLGSLACVAGVTHVDGALVVRADPSQAAAINRLLVCNGVEVSELTPVHASLEDVFLSLVQEKEESHGQPAR
jgi:ABC-type multidrug transport system ATPase subunit